MLWRHGKQNRIYMMIEENLEFQTSSIELETAVFNIITTLVKVHESAGKTPTQAAFDVSQLLQKYIEMLQQTKKEENN